MGCTPSTLLTTRYIRTSDNNDNNNNKDNSTSKILSDADKLCKKYDDLLYFMNCQEWDIDSTCVAEWNSQVSHYLGRYLNSNDLYERKTILYTLYINLEESEKRIKKIINNLQIFQAELITNVTSFLTATKNVSLWYRHHRRVIYNKMMKFYDQSQRVLDKLNAFALELKMDRRLLCYNGVTEDDSYRFQHVVDFFPLSPLLSLPPVSSLSRV